MRPERWLFTIPLRLRSLFRWAQSDQDLDDELRDHLERKTEEYVAKGMTQEEASHRLSETKTTTQKCEVKMAPMNCCATLGSPGVGTKCRKPFRPKTTKIKPSRMREMVTIYFIGLSSFCICEQREMLSLSRVLAAIRVTNCLWDIIRTNNPAIRRTLFQSYLQSHPRRAARKDHLSLIRERQTMSP